VTDRAISRLYISKSYLTSIMTLRLIWI